MALVNLNFESKYLRCNNDVTIILPDKPRSCDPKDFYIPEKKYKTLYENTEGGGNTPAPSTAATMVPFMPSTVTVRGPIRQ